MKTSTKAVAGLALMAFLATGSWTVLADNPALSPGYPGPIKGTTTNVPPGATNKPLPGMTTTPPMNAGTTPPKGAPQ